MPKKTFVDRHIGPSNSEVEFMLQELGEKNLESFIEKVVPENIRIKEKLESVLPVGVSEEETLAELRSLANLNLPIKSLIGLGYYGTYVPSVILRNVLENPSWYTAYTPYQPEISQGRLEVLFAFQTVVCDLTGLDVSNASMLDEASAAAEAMTLARRNSKLDENKSFAVDSNLHPQIKAVIETRAIPLGINLITFDSTQSDLKFLDDSYGVIVSQFAINGEFIDHQGLVARAQELGVIAIAQVDLLAATLYRSAGEFGFDVAIGSAQRFGVPMGFGGPHAGFMAVKKGLERSIPGQLVDRALIAMEILRCVWLCKLGNNI